MLGFSRLEIHFTLPERGHSCQQQAANVSNPSTKLNAQVIPEGWCGPHRRWCIRLLIIGFILVSTSYPLVAQVPLVAGASWPGAELFTNNEVCQIQLEIRPEDLQKLRSEAREFVHANVTQGGVLYQDVAVHLKGSVGSFRPVDDKPGFTLDFARFRTDQHFHGLRRIHLNNSVEDPTYCNEQLGSELFRSAGVPAPRVSRAVVTLNRRKLGLYVLKEGFTEDFLSCYFKTVSGDLF